jgi:formate-dependent nitrite reductase membrane component NrfD
VAHAPSPLVGNSFRLGYRFQRYWDNSMAYAFWSAEVGAGLFAVGCYLKLVPAMVVGLVLVATLKPYFHLAHMGVPAKSWRAILRPDRSWISRGALGIGVLVGAGALHVLDASLGGRLPATLGMLVAGVAAAAALLVMCYQGLAMASSESFALWATPLVPVASFLYSLTAGTFGAWLLGGSAAEAAAPLPGLTAALLAGDLAVLAGLLALARRKSSGGAFSVGLLTGGEYATAFFGLVVLVGLVVPLALTTIAPGRPGVVGLATTALLAGFLAFRLLVFKAAVFEPIADALPGSLGLALRR